MNAIFSVLLKISLRTSLLICAFCFLTVPKIHKTTGENQIWSEPGDVESTVVNTDITDEDAFKTSWTDQALKLGMRTKERNAWYEKLLADIPHAEEGYEVWGIAYEDMDLNGTKDLMLQLKIASTAITPESYPGAFLCIYMNDDPIYLEAYEDSLYLGFTQVLHGDIDNDGYQEIIYSIFTGGNGGAGSSVKAILKYRNDSLEKMQFSGDNSEQFSEGTDVGYDIKVLFGDKENEYKAVCENLEQTVIFQAENAVEENGNRVRQYRTEDEQVGGNCRGYAEFSIESRNGREYLLAKEYLYGEGGINYGVGLATFLMDWDSNGIPMVVEFEVEELVSE